MVERCTGYVQDVEIVKIGSELAMKHNGQPILRLCSDLRSSSKPLAGRSESTNVSLSTSDPAGNPVGFALIRAWLQWCDEHGCKDDNSTEVFPTTLLDVGDQNGPDYDPDMLRLVSGRPGKYIALSHCWGKPQPDEPQPDGMPLYCTTQKNITTRQVGFSAANLPRTFRDAIKVARGLGVQYLWIDSLCITQGENGNWKQESERMQEVYTLAYCTVAATSATNAHSGFLERKTYSECLCVQDDSGRAVNVYTDVANFDSEVEGASLNARAWVMQERLLSCRTIHFGESQMYWECGKGVHCEDLTKLASIEGTSKYFKLDPKFPNLLFGSGHVDTCNFLQSLLVDYSNRKLSKDTDRAVALSGLAARIAKALNCQECYVIFSLYLHRNLLWRRSGVPMTRIPHEPGKVPSWSWMAYTGGIKFVEDVFGDLDTFQNLLFTKENRKVLITDLWGFVNCYLKEKEDLGATSHKIVISSGKEIGWISYDEDTQDLPFDRSAIIGRTNIDEPGHRNLYMLILRRREENNYERIGAGMVQEGYVSLQRSGVYIH